MARRAGPFIAGELPQQLQQLHPVPGKGMESFRAILQEISPLFRPEIGIDPRQEWVIAAVNLMQARQVDICICITAIDEFLHLLFT